MKLKRGVIPIAIIGALLVSLFAPLAVPAAAGSPVLPTSFYGGVTVNDTAVPVDTVITGRIVDAVGSPGEGTITVTEEGKYGDPGYLSVTTDSLDDVDKEIEFYVKLPGWAEAQEADPSPTATYDSDTHQVNLNVVMADVVPPTVTIDIPDYINAANEASVPVTITSNEDGTYSYTISDGTVAHDVIGTGSITGGVDVELSVDLSGLDEVSVTADALVEDAAGNTGDASTDTATKDTVAPAVTITSTASDPTNISPIPMTATFSETVTGFVVGDITVGNGAASNFVAVSGVVYTFDVTPAAEGAVTVDIAAGVAQDAATNPNEAATQFSIIYTINPTVEISSTASDPTNTSPIPMTATFSETVTGFVVGDITVGNGAASNFVAVSGAVYTFDVTPVVEGAVTVDIAAGVAQDAATNPNEAATQFSIIYTIVLPAVTIDSVTSPTNTATQTLTGIRSAGLTVVLTADTAATFGTVTYPTTTTWSCNVTLVEGSNGITATADTSTATATIVLDTTAPTVVSKSPAAGAPGVAVGTTVSVTFSEAMDASTITTSSFTLDSVSGSVSYSSGTYTATFTPSDNLTLGTTYTANLSTAITDATGNPLASAYSWSFTTATASLGDEIADTPSGGTLNLAAGTYSGDVIIDIPITITGTVGETIISGSITIGELTGSNVTIENLTITDYTDFGIRIVKVRAVDTFIIRNNTIQGVEGSLIGIQVDEVEAGGTLTIEQNSISGNETGINLLAAVAAGDIGFNNIVDNEVGLELLRVEHMVSASMNWWGDISGPEEENQNPGGIGDKIELTDSLSYYPWLTREFQTVLDDNIAYFGYPMVWLNTGWNIMSTPVALDPACDTWGEYVDLGDGLDVHATSPAYRFNSQTQAWVALTSDDTLDPCDAIYVRMASDDVAAIVYSPNVSVPSKELYSGWNLVSLARLEEDGMPANEALVTVEEVAGGLTGYKLVVSPSVNAEPPWIYIAGDSIEPWTDPELPQPDGWMWITSGYWVFMLNDGTLAGFTFTPISLWW